MTTKILRVKKVTPELIEDMLKEDKTTDKINYADSTEFNNTIEGTTNDKTILEEVLDETLNKDLEDLINLAIQKATENMNRIIDDQIIVLQNGLYEISRKSSNSPTEAIKQTEKINCYHFEIERLKALKQKFVKGEIDER